MPLETYTQKYTYSDSLINNAHKGENLPLQNSGHNFSGPHSLFFPLLFSPTDQSTKLGLQNSQASSQEVDLSICSKLDTAKGSRTHMNGATILLGATPNCK